MKANDSGIYAIEYLQPRRVYIGATRQGFLTRWASHRGKLAQGTHHCHVLQRDWTLSGPGWFKFVALEMCPPEDRLAPAEQRWINHCTTNGWFLYNQRPANEHLPFPPGLLAQLLTRHNILAPSELWRRIPGMSRAHASNLWTGKSGMGRETMRALHERLGIPYEELMRVKPVHKPAKTPPADHAPITISFEELMGEEPAPQPPKTGKARRRKEAQP